jgi:hypothetical protein
MFLVFSCNSQNQKKADNTKNNTIKPKTNIVVHKEYDDQGNLISVDSSYTYVYSNIKNDSILQKKLFNNFKSEIGKESEEMNELFMDSFFKDELFKMNDFYTDDFFEKNLLREKEQMNNFIKKLDSIKNHFYKEKSEKFK